MLFQHTSHLLLLCTVVATITSSVLSDDKNTRPSHVVSINLRKEFLPKRSCANSSVETIDAVSLEKVDFGCPCESSEQCKPNGSVCKEDNGNKTCGCLEGYFEGFGTSTGKPMCVKKSGVEGSCAKDEHCRDPKTKCDLEWEDRGYCRCIPGYFADWIDDDFYSCIRVKGYGEECLVENSKKECSTPEAACWTGLPVGALRCLCHEDFYESKDDNQNQSCLQKKELGDLCAADKECKDHNSECYFGQCTCQASFLPHEGKCYQEVRVGDPCEINEQCLTPNTSCTESLDNSSSRTCQCKIGLVAPPNEYHCITGFLVDENCSLGWECSGNSYCSIDHVCSCPHNTTANGRRNNCLPLAAKLGDLCEEIDQCTVGKPGPLSNCSSAATGMTKTCNCTNVSVADPSEETCLQKAVKLGDPCVSDKQCFTNIDESFCEESTCACKSGTVESTNSSQCLKPVYLGNQCIDHNQCTENAECLANVSGDFTCECNRLFIGQTNVCWPLAQNMFDNCTIHLQCLNVPESACYYDTCKCVSGFVPNYIGTACMPSVKWLHGTCEESSQCMVANSVCTVDPNDPNIKRCQCQPSNFVQDCSQCFEVQANLNGSCQVTAQCSSGISEDAVCYDNMCTCSRVSKPYDGKCYVPSRLYGTCSADPQCYMGVNENAFCDDTSGTCRCQEGFEEENACLPSSGSPKISCIKNSAIFLLIACFIMLR